MHDYSKNPTNTSARDSMPMHSGLQLQTILCLLMWHLLVIGWNIITQEIKGGARVPAAPPLATPLALIAWACPCMAELEDKESF